MDTSNEAYGTNWKKNLVFNYNLKCRTNLDKWTPMLNVLVVQNCISEEFFLQMSNEILICFSNKESTKCLFSEKETTPSSPY
jgi:hypothetical protein